MKISKKKRKTRCAFFNGQTKELSSLTQKKMYAHVCKNPKTQAADSKENTKKI